MRRVVLSCHWECGESLKNNFMKYIFTFIISICFFSTSAQLTCDSLKILGVSYNCHSIKYGQKKLFNADTAFVNRMQFKTFNLKKASALSDNEKKELSLYKIKLNANDTVLVYDWDMMHQGQIAYFGKVVAKVRINCADSIITFYKFFLKKETVDYVPTRFKIFRLHENDFIIYDKDHPYLNINYYFKKN